MQLFYLRFDEKAKRFEIYTKTGKLLRSANHFLNALHLRNLSPYSVRSHGFDLIVIYRWLKRSRLTMKRLQGKDLYKFIDFERARNMRAPTINRRLVTLRIFYRFLYDKELAGKGMSTPAAHYRGPGRGDLGLFVRRRRGLLQLKVKEEEKLIVPLEIDEVNRFIRGLQRYRDLAIVYLMFLCGLRSCEVRALQLHKVDLNNRELRVRGKGAKERVIPIAAQAVEMIQNYLQFERPSSSRSTELFLISRGIKKGQPLTASGLRSLFRYRRKISGVPKANPHRFRHSFATNMLRNGVSLRVLQDLIGHARGSPVTDRYTHLALGDITDAFLKATEQVEKDYAALRR